METQTKRKSLTTGAMAFMTAAAVISLRGLPLMAAEEMTMFFYIAFATLLFLIPAALVSAELGSAFSGQEGGVYRWVGAAFGKKLGFTAIWLQWIQNVVWYPTVLAFAAAAIAYGIGKPELANNGKYTVLFEMDDVGNSYDEELLLPAFFFEVQDSEDIVWNQSTWGHVRFPEAKVQRI